MRLKNKLDIIGEICIKYDINYEIFYDGAIQLIINRPDHNQINRCASSSLQCLYDDFYEYLINDSEWKDKIKEDFPWLFNGQKFPSPSLDAENPQKVDCFLRSEEKPERELEIKDDARENTDIGMVSVYSCTVCHCRIHSFVVNLNQPIETMCHSCRQHFLKKIKVKRDDGITYSKYDIYD